jgi:hypothetical protein|tara:strand:+ start:106 stop:309 length:204 start_codon:yes stop_codon:yes gene_type:complete
MKIRNGSIYNYHGETVRTIMRTDNGLRLVQSASKLNGFARDADLEKADKKLVQNYIDKVRDLRRVKL